MCCYCIMVTINQAERLRKKYNQEWGLTRYRVFGRKIKRNNEKLKNVGISEEILKKLYEDRILDQKAFLELLEAPQIRIESEKDIAELVKKYKELEDEKEEMKQDYDYLYNMKTEDLWRNFLKVLKFTNTEISPSEMNSYEIVCIHPKTVKVLEKIYKYCKDIIAGDKYDEVDVYEHGSTFRDTELFKILDISKKIAEIGTKEYNYEVTPKKVFRNILLDIEHFRKYNKYSNEEILKVVENLLKLFENEKIKEKIKSREKLTGINFGEILFFYSENPKFFEALTEGKIDVEILFYPPPLEIEEDRPYFYGRIRNGKVKNVIDLAMYGREGNDPYINGEYILYFLPEEMKKYEEAEDFFSEIGLKKKVKAIEKFPFLRKKLRSLSEWLRRQREEGKRYEGVNLRLGAYVKWDDDVNIEEAYNHKIEGDAFEFQMVLRQGIKSPSYFGKKIKEFVDELYSISKKAEENPGIFYALNHWEELSEPEREYLEKELGIGTDELKRVEEWIMNTPKGVYSEAPPLHNGNLGEDVDMKEPRSSCMLDRVFYNYNGKKVRVTEYLVGNGSEDEGFQFEERIIDDTMLKEAVRIRVYDFNGKDEFAVEIYKDGKRRFLNRKEIEEMNGQLENYTLPTLFLKGYFERFTKQTIKA